MGAGVPLKLTCTPSLPPVSFLLISAVENNCPRWYSSTDSGIGIRYSCTKGGQSAVRRELLEIP